MSKSANRFGRWRLRKPYVSQFAINRLMSACKPWSPQFLRKVRGRSGGPTPPFTGGLSDIIFHHFSLHFVTFSFLFTLNPYTNTLHRLSHLRHAISFFVRSYCWMKLAFCIALYLFKLFLVTGFLDKNESKLQMLIKNEVQRRQLRSSAQGRLVPFVFPSRFETRRLPAQCGVVNRV